MIVAIVVIVGAGAASTPQRAKSKFTKHDRTLLAKKARRRENGFTAGRHTAWLDRLGRP